MSRRDLVLGIDSSTQSCTVVLRRLDDGTAVGEARAPHPPTTPPVSEQDPRAWWQALGMALRALDAADLRRVAAVSVGGQGHGLVLLGANDAPLRPAKLWNDTEPAADAALLARLLPPADWAARTGSAPAPALTVSKLAWTERMHPGLVEQAERIQLPADYLVYRLCGRAVTERGGASGTGYFNPFSNGWEPGLAELAVPGLDSIEARLPEIIPSGAAAGVVTARAGLAALEGAVVGAGSGDNMTAALGLGVAEGDTVMSLGTSGTVYAVTATGTTDPSGEINGYADATGRFMPMVTTLNAAKVTDMVRRLLGVGTEAFDDLVLSCAPGARGLVLVPWCDGERTPNRPFARGRFDGLRSDATPAEMARAAVEGVLCGLLAGRDRLGEAGVRGGGRLVLTGGAARSRAYRQVLADLTGETVFASPVSEAAAAGAAVQAAAALLDEPVDAVAARFAVPLQPVATPHQDPGEVRARYHAAVLGMAAT